MPEALALKDQRACHGKDVASVITRWESPVWPCHVALLLSTLRIYERLDQVSCRRPYEVLHLRSSRNWQEKPKETEVHRQDTVSHAWCSQERQHWTHVTFPAWWEEQVLGQARDKLVLSPQALLLFWPVVEMPAKHSAYPRRWLFDW